MVPGPGQIWDAACDKVVERGNWLKFGQNERLTRILLATEDKTLVEASPNDRIVSHSCIYMHNMRSEIRCIVGCRV